MSKFTLQFTLHHKVWIKRIAIVKCDLFFHYRGAKEIPFYYFCDTKLCAKHTYVFFFFYSKIISLDSPVVRLTREFFLYCWDHVSKVNKWCLVDCFHHQFKVFHLRQTFNGYPCHFFVIQNMLIWTMHLISILDFPKQ